MADVELDARIVAAAQAHLAEAARQIAWVPPLSAAGCGSPDVTQAVAEVVESVWPYLSAHPRYLAQGLLERLVEPDRTIIYRVTWVDDHGTVRVHLATSEPKLIADFLPLLDASAMVDGLATVTLAQQAQG